MKAKRTQLKNKSKINFDQIKADLAINALVRGINR